MAVTGFLIVVGMVLQFLAMSMAHGLGKGQGGRAIIYLMWVLAGLSGGAFLLAGALL